MLLPLVRYYALPAMWLSATEGDKDSKLAKLDHWPDTEIVDNETLKLEAVETIWRDYYTGQRLGYWPPAGSFGAELDDAWNCLTTTSSSNEIASTWWE